MLEHISADSTNTKPLIETDESAASQIPIENLLPIVHDFIFF
jgi:hypothetical protein